MRILILTTLVINFLFSQNTNTLIDKKNNLLQEIELSKKMLESAKKKTHISTEELKALSINIELQKNLTETIMQQKDSIEVYKKEIEHKIQKTKQKEETILNSYKNLIKVIYINEFDISFLDFVFSTDSFREAIDRYVYYKNQERLRQNLLNELDFLKSQLISFKNNLDQGILLKNTLLAEFNSENDSLAFLKKEKERVAKQLVNQERELISYITNKKKEAKKIEAEIIETQKQITLKNNNIKEQGVEFEKKKGQLIWPVEKGVLLSRFGEVYHKDLPGIKVINNGVEIGVNKGAEARAVYNGVVSKIVIMQNGLKAIMLRHGKYLTVYTNLKETNVNVGQKVFQGQAIGSIFCKQLNDTGILEFQIWRGLEKINPMNWIKNN